MRTRTECVQRRKPEASPRERERGRERDEGRGLTEERDEGSDQNPSSASAAQQRAERLPRSLPDHERTKTRRGRRAKWQRRRGRSIYCGRLLARGVQCGPGAGGRACVRLRRAPARAPLWVPRCCWTAPAHAILLTRPDLCPCGGSGRHWAAAAAAYWRGKSTSAWSSHALPRRGC